MKRCEYDRLVKLVGNLASEGAAQEFARIAGTLVDGSRYADGIRKFCDQYGEIVINELRKDTMYGMVDGENLRRALVALDVEVDYARKDGHYTMFRMMQGVDFDYNEGNRPIEELGYSKIVALCSNVFHVLADMGLVERTLFKTTIDGSIRRAWRIRD